MNGCSGLGDLDGPPPLPLERQQVLAFLRSFPGRQWFSSAGTLVDEITMADDTGGNENAYFANRYASPIVPEVENHNALFHSSRASLPASFKSGKVDDVKNQLNRYLKRHISQDNGRIATPLKSSNRIF